MRRRIAAETIDNQSHLDTTGSGCEQRVVDALPGVVVGIDIVKQLQAGLGAVDQRDKRVEPFGPLDQKRKTIAVDVIRFGHARTLCAAMLLLQATVARGGVRIQWQDFEGSVRWRA